MIAVAASLITVGAITYNYYQAPLNGTASVTTSLAASTTSTVLSASSIIQGNPMTDTATVASVSSGPTYATPTGTVQFQYSVNGDPFVTYDTQTLVKGSATSISYTPINADHPKYDIYNSTFTFQAVYSGDSNYANSTSKPEPLIVMFIATTYTLQDQITAASFNGITGVISPGTSDQTGISQSVYFASSNLVYGSSATISITVTNEGSTTLQMDAPAYSVSGTGVTVSNPLPLAGADTFVDIAGGASQTFTWTVTATSGTGSATITVSIGYE